MKEATYQMDTATSDKLDELFEDLTKRIAALEDDLDTKLNGIRSKLMTVDGGLIALSQVVSQMKSDIRRVEMESRSSGVRDLKLGMNDLVLHLDEDGVVYLKTEHDDLILMEEAVDKLVDWFSKVVATR